MMNNIRNQKGFALLLSTIIILGGSLILAGGFLVLASTEIKISQTKLKSLQSYYASEAGLEDAIYRVKNAMQYSSSYNLNVGQNQTTITVNATTASATIESQGSAENRIRKTQTVFDLPTTTVGFSYGSQIGDGGLIMGQNSRVNGSVYSNGSITGASGARITGSAWVAQGTAPSVDQSWETANSDYGVGTVSGSIISTLDSSGDVGEYTSLALGSDGFARISYYDATNQDLKFARCLDENCATKNVTTVDSSGNVGSEYTSIALGSDGFARISYYDGSNNDLKFVRCANADCTTKNITVIDSSGDMGQFSSLALGSDGFARISYYASSGGNLKFVRCTNADCTAKNINTLDSSGDVGKYTSLALGSDGFARISYITESGDDLKFARCTDADCATKNINTVDSSPNIDRNTSIALGSDGFARITYYDDGSDNLKFAQCTNADCTTKNITTLDSSGDVGRYSSLKLLSDIARIVYYDGSNGDLKYIQCANADCTTKNISVPDPDNVGQYTSFVFGSDNFGRISYYDVGNADLKFLRCAQDPCSPSAPQVDVAQSFQPAATNRAVKADLYLKKVGSPANATLRLISDSGGSPGTSVLATGLLNASSVGSSYGWLTVNFSTTPTLNANTTYWLVIDAAPDNSNYLVWGGDSANGYTRGAGKKSNDWSIGNWSNLNADLNFRVYMGGTDNQISTVSVDGSAYAHFMDTVTVGGNAGAFTLNSGTIGGSVSADTISNCTIGGNASYNVKTSCTIGGTQTTPTTPPSDPAVQAMPITQEMIDAWKAQAEAGGTINGDCGDGGVAGCDIPTNGTLTLGPKKINGNLILQNNQTLIVSGTIYVTGYIDIDNGSAIQLDPSYGIKSGLVFSDGTIHLANNGNFSGSGQAGSYLMLMTLASGGGHHGGAIDLHNNASGVIFYAANGLVYLHNNVNATQLTAKAITLDNNATISYDPGLANALFSGGGSSGSFKVKSWKEIE